MQKKKNKVVDMFLTKDNKLKWNWIATGAGITLALVFAGIFWFDKPLYLFLRQFDCRLWAIFDVVFGVKVWLVVALITLLVFYIKKLLKEKPVYKNEENQLSPKVFIEDSTKKVKKSYAFYIFWSVASASLIAFFLKIIIGRARPIFFEALDLTGFFPFTWDWAFNSMPSGHTVASFAGFVMLGMLAPKIKWFTWSFATLIGISRVCFGAHWPSDVILGAFIGMVVADVVKHVLKKHF